MTTRANLYVDQGVDFLTELVIQTDDRETFFLTNETFFCQIRRMYSSSNLIEAELRVVSSENDSVLELYINPEETENLRPGKYQYDVIMKNSDTSRIKILEGLIFVLPTVTKIEKE